MKGQEKAYFKTRSGSAYQSFDMFSFSFERRTYNVKVVEIPFPFRNPSQNSQFLSFNSILKYMQGVFSEEFVRELGS